VQVTGPGGYSKTVNVSSTLSQLALGVYTISAPRVSKAGSVVSEIYDGTVSSATATVAESVTPTVTATYTKRGGTGAVWIGFSDATPPVKGYDAALLAAPGSLSGAGVIAPTGGRSTSAVTFDSSGNLWVLDSGTSQIVRFTPTQLATTPIPAPSVVISNPADPTTSFNSGTGLAFDPSGNLWVRNFTNAKIVKFTPAQLAASGQPVPSVVLSSTTFDGLASINRGYGLAFDSEGNLWLNNADTRSVVKFSAGSLTASGAPTPSAQIKDYTSGESSTLGFVFGLAFDSSGFLWVANNQFSPSNRISKYDVRTLTGSSVVTPSAIINLASGTRPLYLAFDNSGALWAYTVNRSADGLVKFNSPSTITGLSNTPTPDVSLTFGVERGIGSFAFSPAPNNLPLPQLK
jgi:sugar lactone lactonase YvrE